LVGRAADRKGHGFWGYAIASCLLSPLWVGIFVALMRPAAGAEPTSVVSCGRCSQLTALPVDELRFERRGKFNGRPVLKCLKCGSGQFLKGQLLRPRLLTISDDLWRGMEESWNRSFGPSEEARPGDGRAAEAAERQQYVEDVRAAREATSTKSWEPGRVDAFTSELNAIRSARTEARDLQGAYEEPHPDECSDAFVAEIRAVSPAAKRERLQSRRAAAKTRRSADPNDHASADASYCDMCGTKAREGAQFCKSCGERLPLT